MKSITFVRHAKSSWKFKVDDHERPLNKRGHFDANFMASISVVKSITPEFVLCSTAQRARETCDYFIKNQVFGVDEVEYNPNIYDFSGFQLANEIRNLNPKLSNILIIGHNHALTDIVNSMTTDMLDPIPTCGLVQLSFSSNKWSDLRNGTVQLKLYPKNLRP